MGEAEPRLSSAVQDLMGLADMERLGGRYIGDGGTGIVFELNDRAVKVAYHEDYVQKIQHEKNVYERLGNCDGVVDCFDLSTPGIRMIYMANGDLCQFLARTRSPDFPSPKLQLSWLRQMALALGAVHDRRVLVADISIRNFLVDKDLSIKLSDFSESSILDIDCDVRTADDRGYTVSTEISQLGAVFYEVVTGKQCRVDLYKHQPDGPAVAEFPRREDLPSTEDLWLGAIIENCWSQRYATCHELSRALDSAESPREDKIRTFSPPPESRAAAEALQSRLFHARPLTALITLGSLAAASLLLLNSTRRKRW